MRDAKATTTTTSKDVLPGQKPQPQISAINNDNYNASVSFRKSSSRPVEALNSTTGSALTKAAQGIGPHTTPSPQDSFFQVTGTSPEPITGLPHEEPSSNDASRKFSKRSDSSSRADVAESQLVNLEFANPRVSQNIRSPSSSEQTEPKVHTHLLA